jgi:autotransporter-associated beta strand protein
VNFRLHCSFGDRLLAAGLALVFCAPPVAAAQVSWTGAGASASWADAGNWSTGSVPPDDGTADVSIVSLGSGNTLLLDGARNIRSLTVRAGGDVLLHPGSVAGSTLTVATGNVSRTQAGLVAAAVPLGGDSGHSATGPSLATAFASSAVVRLLASPLYAGRTTISLGILQVGPGSVPDQSQVSLGVGGMLDLAGTADLVGSLAGVGSVTNTSAAQATLLIGGDDTDASFAGALGASLSDQANGPGLALVKLGRGAQTLSGANKHTGGTQVQEGALWVASGGSLPGGGNVLVNGSSTQPALFGGAGTVGAISTRYSAVPGTARVQPGMPGSIGILDANQADLSHGAISFRLANLSGNPGVGYDVLDLGAGTFTSDADTDFTFDLSGLAATGGPVRVIRTGVQPALPRPSQVHVVNNPSGYTVTLTADSAGLHVSVAGHQAPAPGFIVAPALRLFTTQSGGVATFTVQLATQPTADVTVGLSSSDPSAGVVTPASLTFTAANFDIAQQATVTGAIRGTSSGNLPYLIQFSPAVSADAAYATMIAPSVSALSLDTHLLTVSAAPGLVTIAGQQTASFTVALTQAPKGPVTLALRSSDPAQGQPSPALLQFGPGVTQRTVTVEGVATSTSGCAVYSILFYPSLSLADASFNGLELPPVSLCNQGGATSLFSGPTALSVTFSSAAAAAPGSRVFLVAHVVNTRAADLAGARLDLSPDGLSLESAAVAGTPLPWDGSGFLLPTLAAGSSLDATVVARVVAAPGGRAGSSALVFRPAVDALSAPSSAWFTAGPLQLDVGGCSSRSGTKGPALSWIGLAAAAFLARRRRRSAASPGADQLHDRRGVVPRQLGLARPALAHRVDADHGDALLPVAHHHVGMELAGRRDLHRVALDVDAAAGLDLSGQGEARQVGLVRGPAHGEEHLAQRVGGVRGGSPREAADLSFAHLDLAPAALDGDRSAQRAHRDRALAVGRDEEVAAGARGDHVAVLDLQGDRSLPGLDHRFDPAADARAQVAGLGPADAQLAAVEDVHAHAIDRDLRFRVRAGADGIGAEDAVAFARRGPAAVAALQLDATRAPEQDGAALGRAAVERRSLSRGLDGGRGGLAGAGAEKGDPGEAAQRQHRLSHRNPYTVERGRASTAVRVRA